MKRSSGLDAKQQLTIRDGVYTFLVTPNRGAASFQPVNTNGAQRGWRPIVHWLPQRISNIRIVSGSEFSPVITDDFLLIPNPRECDPSVTYQVMFTAEPIE